VCLESPEKVNQSNQSVLLPRGLNIEDEGIVESGMGRLISDRANDFCSVRQSVVLKL